MTYGGGGEVGSFGDVLHVGPSDWFSGDVLHVGLGDCFSNALCYM